MYRRKFFGGSLFARRSSVVYACYVCMRERALEENRSARETETESEVLIRGSPTGHVRHKSRSNENSSARTCS